MPRPMQEDSDVRQVEQQDAADALGEFRRALGHGHKTGNDLAHEWSHAARYLLRTRGMASNASTRTAARHDDHRDARRVEGEVSGGSCGDTEAEQKQDVHDEGHNAGHTHAGSGEGRVQAGLLR